MKQLKAEMESRQLDTNMTQIPCSCGGVEQPRVSYAEVLAEREARDLYISELERRVEGMKRVVGILRGLQSDGNFIPMELKEALAALEAEKGEKPNG